MDFLPKTTDLVASGEYFGSPQDFLGNFGAAYDAVRGQILKFEGRQDYRESGDLSYEAFAVGDTKRAIELIRQSKQADDPFYKKLAANKVEIVRVRPVKKPLSEYLAWEIETYKISEEFGERIFFFHYDQLAELLETNVRHDFMVFDSRFAFVHDYDNHGELKGGWRFQDFASICKLLLLFSIMKANSYHYRLCI